MKKERLALHDLANNHSTDEQLLMYTDHILVWYWYIDNLFVIWNGPEDLLKIFLKRLNKNEFNLTFTISYDSTGVNFLNVVVKQKENNMLSSYLFRKPTAGNSILHASSFHPKPLMRSIPYSQYLRTRRNCSDKMSFQQEADVLRDCLLLRGYTKPALKKLTKEPLGN